MLVSFVLTLTILLGCCGLALDIAMLQVKRLQMQNAADAAALGAMYEGERGDSAGAYAAGYADAKLNGFTNGVNGVSITYNYPPATGLNANNGGAFQVTITQPATAIFMGKSILLKVQSTALIPPCGYLMATSTSYPTMWLQSASLLANCPVYSSQYLTVDYFASSRYEANYVSGTAAASASSSGTLSDPIYNFPAMSDPLSYLPSPSFTACDYLGIPTINLVLGKVLYPGTYCGLAGLPAITIISSTVTFMPGLYIICGGISVTGSTLTSPTGGVTLYMTKSSGLLANYFGILSFNNSTISMSAPADTSANGVPGILIYGDRNWIPTYQEEIQLQSSTFTGDGIIYFQKTGMYEYNSNIVPPHYFGLILNDVHEFFGNIHLGSNFSFVQGGNPFRPKEGLAE